MNFDNVKKNYYSSRLFTLEKYVKKKFNTKRKRLANEVSRVMGARHNADALPILKITRDEAVSFVDKYVEGCDNSENVTLQLKTCAP